MIIRVNETMFRNEFVSHGRGNSFSYDGFQVLFDHLEELDNEYGEDSELDVIAIDCNYCEYSIEELTEYNCYGYLYSLEQYMIDSNTSDTEDIDMDDYYSDFLDMLRGYTTVLEVSSDTYIIQTF